MPSPEQFRFVPEPNGDPTVVASGDIDFACAPAFRACVATALLRAGDDAPLTVDLQEVARMDSSCLSVLVAVLRRGARLVLRVAADSQPARLLRRTGIDSHMTVVLAPAPDMPPDR